MKRLMFISLMIVALFGGSNAFAIPVNPEVVPEITAMIDGLGGMDLTIDAGEFEIDEDGKKWKLKDVTVMTGWNDMGTVTFEELEFDADPIIYNNLLFSNNSGVDQNWSITISLPTTWAAGTMRGSIDTSVIGTDALVSAPSGGSIYSALIDGSTVKTLQPYPFTLSTPQDAVSASDAFGWEASVPVTSDMGITISFTLSPGDTATVISDFEIIPEPASLAMIGLVCGSAFFIRRRFIG